MHSPGTSSRTTGPWNISAVAPRFGSTKLAADVPHVRAFCECVGVCAIRAALLLAVLSALLLMAARPAQAQTEPVLYNFPSGSDGGYQGSRLTSDGAGNLYGTTNQGGLGYGTVFELLPNGNGGWNETALYTFTGGADGANPMDPVIFDNLGNLYGTTGYGGANGYGVVFELSPEGTSWTETVLYSFANDGDGAYPGTGLIMDPAGNLYGETFNVDGNHSVFELSPSGSGWTELVIYASGIGNCEGLTMDAAGDIFGFEYEDSPSGEVFELSPNGNGGWNSSVIFNFADFHYGSHYARSPHGTLVWQQAAQAPPGVLYGTTSLGGKWDVGTVFMLYRWGTWQFVVLMSFTGYPEDGAHPMAGIVLDAAGNIYGTTQGGGKSGMGTVFEIGFRKYSVLWSFNGSDGSYPVGSLIVDSAGNLYGTTSGGGSGAAGVVFEVTPPPVKTTTTLTSSPNPSAYGQEVTFTTTITSSAGAPPDGETVTFMEGKKALGTGALGGGSASFTTSALKLGTNAIKVVYGGDLKFAGSTSTAVKQVVDKATTTTTLTSSQNPSNVAQSVTFTASVTPQFTGTVKGTVTFYDGTTTLTLASVKGGAAKYTTKKLTSGAHSITATYNGSTDFTGSSASLTQTVN